MDNAGRLPFPLDEVMTILAQGAVSEEHGLLQWSSNYTFLLSLTHEDQSLLSIYKPRKGERPLWDFPTGALCYREYAAYLTAEVLGWQIVPPTVLRQGPHGLGSMQLFIDHDPEVTYFNFDDAQKPALQRLALFDCLINNADRKGGHCLLDENGHLWGIDHGITFHEEHKLRTVIWEFAGDPVPEALLPDLERLAQQLSAEAATPYRQALTELLTEAEITAFTARVERLLKAQVFPMPGSGPNTPWPPV